MKQMYRTRIDDHGEGIQVLSFTDDIVFLAESKVGLWQMV